MLDSSVVEWLRLVVLLSVLGSHLIGVKVLLRVPAGRIPQGRVHYVSGAVVDESHSWTVEVGLVSDVGNWLKSLLFRELVVSFARSEYLSVRVIWVSVRCTEGGLGWLVVGVVGWVGVWQGSTTVESGGGNEGVVVFRNVNRVEACSSHGLLGVIEEIFGEHISALLGDSFLHQ